MTVTELIRAGFTRPEAEEILALIRCGYSTDNAIQAVCCRF